MVVADKQTDVRQNPETPSPVLQSLLRTIVSCSPGALLVGGALRDLLSDAAVTGRSGASDVDLLVTGEPAKAASALATALGGHAFELDPQRGQHRVALPQDAAVRYIDIAAIGESVEENLWQRDFTINAMAAPIESDGRLGRVIDPCGGSADLEAKRLRMVSERGLIEDPLRLLRGVRQATELRAEIEPETWAAIQRLAPTVTTAAAERQREELCRILATPRSAAGIRLLDKIGLLQEILPELMPAHGVSQPGPHHYWDVFDHSVEALANLDMMLSDSAEVEPESQPMREIFDEAFSPLSIREYMAERPQGESRLVLLKLAGLLHDVAKPETKTVEAEAGKSHFYGHSELGATKAAVICRRLRFGKDETEFVALLVQEHLRPTQLSSSGPPSNRALYRFFRDLGDAAIACLVLLLADGAAAAGPRLKRDRWIRSVGFVSYLLERHAAQLEDVVTKPRLITGQDLMKELLIEQGPLVGALMSQLDLAIGAGEITSRDAALTYARACLDGLPDQDTAGQLSGEQRVELGQ